VKVTPLRNSPNQCACQYSLLLPQHLRQSQCPDWPVVDRQWNDLPFNAANVILCVFGTPFSIRKKLAPVAARKKTQSFVGLLCPSGGPVKFSGQRPSALLRLRHQSCMYIFTSVLLRRIIQSVCHVHHFLAITSSNRCNSVCKCAYSSKGMQLAR
jgi:hypothetical protein